MTHGNPATGKDADLDITSSETCDRCGPATAAKMVTVLPGGGILTFCGHCHNKHALTLLTLGAVFHAA